MKKLLLLPLMASISLPSLALPPMRDDAGFNGLVNLGAAGGEIESNFLAQSANFDLGSEKIDSFGSPDSESIGFPMANFDVGYTLASKKTRFSIANDVSDFREFETSTRLSVRHEFDSLGSMRLDGLAPSALATEVYTDPYQTGVDRKSTDKEVSGGRFTWDNILGSNFEVIVAAKKLDLDDEHSGQALGLSQRDQDLLDREGDIYNFEVGYKFTLNDSHTLRPSVKYIDRDLDGDAMSQDGVEIALRHVYKGTNMKWLTQVSYADLSGDKENPVPGLGGDKNDADVYGFSSAMSFPGSIGFLGKWTPNVGVRWADADSDVDFNDTNIWVVSAGLSRKF